MLSTPRKSAICSTVRCEATSSEGSGKSIPKKHACRIGGQLMRRWISFAPARRTCRIQQRVCFEAQLGGPGRRTGEDDKLAGVANIGGQDLLADFVRKRLLQLADQFAHIPGMPDDLA